MCECARACRLCKLVQYWPLEEQESAVAAWHKQAPACVIFVDGSIMGEKALHIPAYLGAGSFARSDGCVLLVISGS